MKVFGLVQEAHGACDGKWLSIIDTLKDMDRLDGEIDAGLGRFFDGGSSKGADRGVDRCPGRDEASVLGPCPSLATSDTEGHM